MKPTILLWIVSAGIAAAQQYAFTNLAGLPGAIVGSADGSGRAARFNFPSGLAVDAAGNLYVGDRRNQLLRKVSPTGAVTTLAGKALTEGTNDGPGTVARFSYPFGVAVDRAGYIYVADRDTNTIRKVSPTGFVTTLAGQVGPSGYYADGTNASAVFSSPFGLAADGAGNIYVADADNNAIRKVTPSGVVTTVAGRPGAQGSNDGVGADARFYFPTGLALDSATNIYVADCYNHTIRKVTPDGVVTTLAGQAGVQGHADGAGNAAQFFNPYSVAVDSSNHVFVADWGNSTIRMLSPEGSVSTIGGLYGYSGTSDGTGSGARFFNPCGITVDAAGNLYVADTSNNRISKGVLVGTGSVSLPNLAFYLPAEWTEEMIVSASVGATNDSGTLFADVPLYVSSALVNIGGGAVTNGFVAAYYVDGALLGTNPVSFSAASPLPPSSYVTLSSFFIGPLSPGPHTIKIVADPTGQVLESNTNDNTLTRTLTIGAPGLPHLAPYPPAGWSDSVVVSSVTNSTRSSAVLYTNETLYVDWAVINNGDGPVTNAFSVELLVDGAFKTSFDAPNPPVPVGTIVYATNIAIGTFAAGTHTVTVIADPANTVMETERSANSYTTTFEVADPSWPNLAAFQPPGWSDKVVVSTLPGGTNDLGPYYTTNTLYVEWAVINNGNSPVTNSFQTDLTVDGLKFSWTNSAPLNAGNSITAGGSIGTLDAGIHTITITHDSTGVVTETTKADNTYTLTIAVIRPNYQIAFANLAGLPGADGGVDGSETAARFFQPETVAADASGNLYVADTGNHTLRKVTPSGLVTTLAGLAGAFGSLDGTGAAARFNQPYGLAVDAAGNLYVADSGNHAIRKVTPGGVSSTLAGQTGAAGAVDGPLPNARFNWPMGIAVDAAANVYVADTFNHAIRRITPAGSVSTLAGQLGVAGANDGTGTMAQFNGPYGLALDGRTNLYVADLNNHTIRQVTPGGVVTTLAGQPGRIGSADGPGAAARFFHPRGITADLSGLLYVADRDNHTVRMLSFAANHWTVSTVGGLPGKSGSADGTGSTARFNRPGGLATDSSGNLYVADTDNQRLSKGALFVAQGAPNLAAYQPAGWADSLIAATVPGSLASATVFTPFDPVYVNFAFLNNGTLPVEERFATALYLDNVLQQTWQTDPPLNPGDSVKVQGLYLGALTPGTHKLTLQIDPGQVVAQSSVSDKSQTRTITIAPNAGPNTNTSLTVLTNGNGMVTPDYHGKPIVINKFYTITAKPGPNSVFAGWTGGVNTNLASIKFAAQPNMFMQANFVPNPFPAVKGTYSGLVYDTNGVAQPSAGAFTLTVMAKGGYSGSLQLGGNRYSLSGQFDANGRSVKSFARAKSTVVTVNLQLDLTDGSDTISGSASGNGWAAVLLGDRAVFDAKTHLNPLAGAYTLALDGSYGCPALPGGDSCGALTVSAAGQISLKGSLADGTKITQTAPMSKRGQWPLYAPLYGGQGLILGWLNFNTNAPAEDLTGSLAWLKPSAPKSTYYSHGFTNIADAWGSHYQPPNAFAGAAASLVLSGAALSGGASNRLSIQSNKGQAVDSKKIILTFTPATGLFSGKLAVTNSAKPIVFNGVVLQKRNAGRGYFLQLGATPNDAIVAPNLPVAPVLAKSAQLPPPGQSGEVRLDP